MVRIPTWPALILWIPAVAAWAEDWERDRWHHVTETSPFYVADRADLHGAAILQDNGRFALMVLGQPEDGALVSVNLAMTESVGELTSTLVMPDGNILVRDVHGAQLVVEPAEDGGSVTYSFGIAPDDVEQFMSAELWRIKAGETLATIPLDGSRDAISAAIEARASEIASDAS